MSWRQATATHANAITSVCFATLPTSNFQFPRIDEPRSLRRNFGHSYWMQPFEKLPRRMPLESRIRRLDDEEEAIGRGTSERVDVEDRVIRLRQLVQRPHADEARQRRAKHRRLEGDRNELGPAVERALADVHRISDHRE